MLPTLCLRNWGLFLRTPGLFVGKAEHKSRAQILAGEASFDPEL